MYEDLADLEVSRAIFREPTSNFELKLVIRKLHDGSYTVGFKNAEGHPAAYRMPGVAAFVKSYVLPLVKTDVSGEYPFEPHDALREARQNPTLCFARDPACENAIVFPDYYQMFDYSGLLEDDDFIEFEDKLPKVLFAGTTTGSLDPALNRRVQACIWSSQKQASQNQKYDMKLTSVCQMTVETLSDYCRSIPIDVNAILAPHVSKEAHFRARYLLNIEGNTCSWNRLPMIMNTKGVTLHMDSFAESLWYYPMLRSGRDYVRVEKVEDLPGIVDELEKDVEKCKRISENAREFVKKHCTSSAAAEYAARLLERLCGVSLTLSSN